MWRPRRQPVEPHTLPSDEEDSLAYSHDGGDDASSLQGLDFVDCSDQVLPPIPVEIVVENVHPPLRTPAEAVVKDARVPPHLWVCLCLLPSILASVSTVWRSMRSSVPSRIESGFVPSLLSLPSLWKTVLQAFHAICFCTLACIEILLAECLLPSLPAVDIVPVADRVPPDPFLFDSATAPQSSIPSYEPPTKYLRATYLIVSYEPPTKYLRPD